MQDRKRLYALSHTDLVSQFSGSTLAEAERYYREQRVMEAEIKGNTIRGVVQENELEEQIAEVVVEDGGLYVACTCGHRGPGPCVHIGALLMAWLNERETFLGYEDPPEFVTDEHAASTTGYEDEYHEMLAEQTLVELRAIARRRGIEIKGTRKEPIVEELAAQLSRPEGIRKQIHQLDELTRQLFAYLNLIISPTYGLSSEHIIDTLSGKKIDVSRRTLITRLNDLAELGLLLTFKRDNLVYYSLPQAVRLLIPPQPGFIAPYVDEAPAPFEIKERSSTSIVQALYTVWNYVLQKHPHREKSLPRRAQERWPQLSGWDYELDELTEMERLKRDVYGLYGQSMTVPPPPYRLGSADRAALRTSTGHSDPEIDFYYALLESIRAVEAQPGAPVTTRPQIFEQLLSMSPSLRMYTIAHAWLTTTTWSEMDLLRQVKDDLRLRRSLSYPSFQPADLYREWGAGRQTVLRFLTPALEGEWLSVEGLLKAIFEIMPNMLHSQSNTTTWWLESTHTKKQFGTTYEDWHDSVGQFVRAVLEGPLLWLGAVSLGYREGKLLAFRVTPAGAFIMHRRANLVEAEIEPAAEDAVRFENNLTVSIVPGYAPAQLHELLHHLGTLEETTPQRFVYRISAEGVLHALEQGQTIERLLEQLEAWSGKRVPADWKIKVQEWSQNYGKLHIYDEMTLIEMADDYALQELFSNTSLREHVIYQFSPRLVAIRPEALDRLVGEMEKQGYMPRIE